MIIAELASNHGGDMTLACLMIDAAKAEGAGMVKCQLYDAEEDKGKPHYDWVKQAQLSYEQAKGLFDYGEKTGIEVFFSVFGTEFIEWCEKMGAKRYKLAYGQSRYLYDVFKTGKPTYLSTDLNKTISDRCFVPQDDPAIKYLYCVPKYPAISTQFHLSQVDFNKFAGLSDHSIGIDVAKIALARGARIIEKHFILCRNLSKSPEKAWSIEPHELRELVQFDKLCQEVIG